MREHLQQFALDMARCHVGIHNIEMCLAVEFLQHFIFGGAVFRDIPVKFFLHFAGILMLKAMICQRSQLPFP